MSDQYKHGDKVPSEVLCKRLNELSDAVTEGRGAVLREFDMRVPAELDRDADIVLSEAASRIAYLEAELAYLEARLAAAEADAGRWMDVSVDGYPDKACKVLIARGNATVLGAWIGDSFWYSNEKVAALFWRHLPKPPDPARGVG